MSESENDAQDNPTKPTKKRTKSSTDAPKKRKTKPSANKKHTKSLGSNQDTETTLTEEPIDLSHEPGTKPEAAADANWESWLSRLLSDPEQVKDQTDQTETANNEEETETTTQITTADHDDVPDTNPEDIGIEKEATASSSSDQAGPFQDWMKMFQGSEKKQEEVFDISPYLPNDKHQVPRFTFHSLDTSSVPESLQDKYQAAKKAIDEGASEPEQPVTVSEKIYELAEAYFQLASTLTVSTILTDQLQGIDYLNTAINLNGHIHAQMALGYWQHQEMCFESDVKKPIPEDWSSHRIYQEGMRYLGGIGEPMHGGLARYYLELAAKQEHPEALRLLGWINEWGRTDSSGSGAHLDKIAYGYYQRAADANDAFSQRCYGNLYLLYRGVEVPQGKVSDKIAYYWILLGAKAGEQRAEYLVGWMHMYRRIPADAIKNDDNQAAYWFFRSGSHADAEAQYSLGSLLKDGRASRFGSPQEQLQLAVVWLEKASKLGLARAQVALAHVYLAGVKELGKASEEEEKQAVHWLDMAASKEKQPAVCFELGKMYASGKGVVGGICSENDRVAQRWLTLAAENDDSQAQFLLGQLFVQDRLKFGDNSKLAALRQAEHWWSNGKQKKHLPSIAALADLYRLHHKQLQLSASQWRQQAIPLYEILAQSNDTDASLILTTLLLSDSDKKHHTRGFQLLQDLIRSGPIYATTCLAYCYQKGLGVPENKVNYIRAAEYYRQAAEDGEPVAQNNLGYLYDQGHGVPGGASHQNVLTGITWYEKAAAQKMGVSLNNLGYLYLKGYADADLKPDFTRAKSYFEQGAQLEDPSSMWHLATMYLNEQGLSPQETEHRLEKAKELLAQAAKHGHRKAKKFLLVLTPYE